MSRLLLQKLSKNIEEEALRLIALPTDGLATTKLMTIGTEMVALSAMKRMVDKTLAESNIE